MSWVGAELLDCLKRMKRARDDDDSLSQPLAGRVLLITGAGGGIGRAAALELGRRGAKIIVADVNAAAAADTAKMVAAVQAEAEAVEVDVSNEESVARMVSAAVKRFGRLDGALNAAGIEGHRAKLHESSAWNFDQVLGVNLRGVFLCMKAEISQMLAQDAPETAAASSEQPKIDTHNYSIVNVSSTAASSMPEFSCYCASKAAINGITRSAAKEYASEGIRVNAVAPSTTDTPMVARFAERWPEWQAKQNASFAVGRIGTAEEVAACCAFLFSPECPMMTGTVLTIDGSLSA